MSLAGKDWYSAAELTALALPGVPQTRQGVDAMAKRRGWTDPQHEGAWWRKRKGHGGGIEFHRSVLPPEAQFKVVYTTNAAAPAPERPAATHRDELWRRFNQLPNKTKAAAAERLRAVQMHCKLVQGMPAVTAQMRVAAQFEVSFNTIGRWRDMVAGHSPHDWWAALAPHHVGRPGKNEIADAAWDAFIADYLRLERPNLTDCYDRVAAVAKKAGWAWPSRSTVTRRVQALPTAVVVAAREGMEALKQLYPAQKRDRSAFHALEAVNLDGHKWDLFVRWPDGTVARPQMLVIQDLYSGRVLAWRVDQTLHKGLVRLAFGDMVEQFGVPSFCWLDNGRENAAKAITGGVPNRFRFRVLDEDPLGLLPLLNVEVHWTTPYSGQSKPIERAFRDFASSIAKHPAFAGAYTGNTPDAKPENYGSTAVPLADFLRVFETELVRHNAKPGRRSAVCQGKLSFDEAFFASYKTAPIRKASEAQRQLFLLAADAVRADKRDGAILLEGNRYWSADLTDHAGKRVVVRFDPDALHEPVHVYRLDGEHIGLVPCLQAAGFADVNAAREHGRARRTWMKAQRAKLKAELRMSLPQVADLHEKHERETAGDRPQEAAEARVIRPIFRTEGANALKADEEEMPEGERLLLQFAEMRRGGPLLSIVEEADED